MSESLLTDRHFFTFLLTHSLTLLACFRMRITRNKKYFLEAIKEEIEESFEKAGDVVDFLGDKFEHIGDRLENVTQEISESETFVSIKRMVKVAALEIKEATKLDIDLDAMVDKIVHVR